MTKLAVALVTGEGMETIEFENDKYIYVSYDKVIKDNVNEFTGEERDKK